MEAAGLKQRCEEVAAAAYPGRALAR
jgi:hypothetical protein